MDLDQSHLQPLPSDEAIPGPMAFSESVRQMVIDMDESEVIFLEPANTFDPAILGLTEGDLGPMRVIYDSAKCVTQLMEANEWEHDEALEFFEFNTLGTHMSGWPLFLTRPFSN